ASVGVQTPPYSVPITNRKITAIGRIARVEAKRSDQLYLGPNGPASGLRRHVNQTIREKTRIVSRPGMIPAMNSAAIETSVNVPKNANARLGGMRMPSVPEAASTPVESLGS